MKAIATKCGIIFGAIFMLVTSATLADNGPQKHALLSLSFLSGTWHCTGGKGPDEDDTYTVGPNWWYDTDSLGGLTSGTYDVTRQAWIAFYVRPDGEYGMMSGGPEVQYDADHVYHPDRFSTTRDIDWYKYSNTRMKFGDQICAKK